MINVEWKSLQSKNNRFFFCRGPIRRYLNEQLINVYHIFNCLVVARCRDAALFTFLLLYVSNNTHFVVLWILFYLTSVEAAYSPRHGLSEDHAVLIGRSCVFNVRVVIHADLWEGTQTNAHISAQPVSFIIHGLDANHSPPIGLSLSTKTCCWFTWRDMQRRICSVRLHLHRWQRVGRQKAMETSSHAGYWLCFGEVAGGVGGSDLVFGALCMKSSCVVSRWLFDGGTRVAHVFRGLLTLLRRRTGAGQSRLEEQREAEAMMWDSENPCTWQ